MLKSKPNHTQVPNQFIDEWLPKLKGSEIQVFLVICRQTIGWHKETDAISISQMQKKTGLSNRCVINSVRTLEEEHGIIVAHRGENSTTTYEIAYEESSQVVNKVHGGSEQSSQVGSEQSSHTKETIKQTNTKDNSPTANAPDDSPKKKKEPYPKVEQRHLDLADKLLERVAEMYGGKGYVKKANTRKWANELRLLIENTDETPDSVSKFIDFLHTSKSQTARFWKTKVCSGDKVREHMGKIRVQFKDEAQKQREQQQRDIKFGNTPPEKIPHNIVDEHGDTIPNPDMFPDAAFNAQARNKHRRHLKRLAEQKAAQKENGA